METNPPDVQTRGLPRVYWLYLAGAVLVAAGFADFPLIAYHFSQASVVTTDVIPVFYAVAMGVSGAGSLVFGRLFDRFGFWVLIILTIIAALFAPLVFLGGFWPALIGMALWGLGMGVHELIIPAAVAPMVPLSTALRRTGCSLPVMASSGSWAAQGSDSYMGFLSHG